MTHHLWAQRAAAALALMASLGTSAQDTGPKEPVLVTANPLGNRIAATASSVLAGETLLLQGGRSLGQTLESLPGVSTSGFGPAASRPIIRGLDGERLRILSNSGATLDASSLSDDHAVPIDPLVANRIEVLRGPASLFFGGNALGGAVNILDNRIPDLELDSPRQGAVETRVGGAASSKSAAAVIDVGLRNRWALHADAFGRDSGDLRVPRFLRPSDGPSGTPSTTVTNSAQRVTGGAVGSNLRLGDLTLGAAIDSFESLYGVVASDDVKIDMRRRQLRALADYRRPDALWTDIKLQVNLTHYRHQEIEGSGAVGTTFSNRGSDVRLEARHAPMGAVTGVWGVQTESGEFSANGDEAFVPPSHTRRDAVFLLEQLQAGRLGLSSLGLRVERASVRSAGDSSADESARFGGPTARRFNLSNWAWSQVLPLHKGWHASLSLSRSQRAPTAFELFANGLHAATGAFEVGEAELGAESGRQQELGLGWSSGAHRLRAALHRTVFSRYISLSPTGRSVTHDGLEAANGQVESVPLMQFEGVRAKLAGWEIEGQWRAAEGTWLVDLIFSADRTNGQNLDTAQPLPRIAPTRVGAAMQISRGVWSVQWHTRYAARQTRTPVFDLPTPGHTRHDLNVVWRIRPDQGAAQTLAYLKIENLGNTLAYNASALQTVRFLAPQPGRSLSAGLRVDW